MSTFCRILVDPIQRQRNAQFYMHKFICVLLAWITCITLSRNDTQNGCKRGYELLAETKSSNSKLCKISNGNIVMRVHHSTCALYAVDASWRAAHVNIKNSLKTSTNRLMHFLHTRDAIICLFCALSVSCTMFCFICIWLWNSAAIEIIKLVNL